MGYLSWIIMGLIAGLLAKLIMPSKNPEGFVITIVIGIVGAFVGSYIGSLLGLEGITGFNAGSFLLAIGGASLLLSVFRMIRRKLPF